MTSSTCFPLHAPSLATSHSTLLPEAVWSSPAGCASNPFYAYPVRDIPAFNRGLLSRDLAPNSPYDTITDQNRARQALALARATRAAVFAEEQAIRRRLEEEELLINLLKDEAEAMQSKLEVADQHIAIVRGWLYWRGILDSSMHDSEAYLSGFCHSPISQYSFDPPSPSISEHSNLS